MGIDHDYWEAVKLLKKHNPLLAETIDTISKKLTPHYGLIFPEEPDIRVKGYYPHNKDRIELFWRADFFSPNNLVVRSIVPRDHPSYTGMPGDPEVRMGLYFFPKGQFCLELGNRTPQEKVFGLVFRTDPPEDEERMLSPPLYSLAKAAGIDSVFDLTVRGGQHKDIVKKVVL